jgi:Mrp family chromosome partitioning ATPase
MKPFALPRRESPSANEEQMARASERPPVNDLRSYLQRRPGLGSQPLGTEPEHNGKASAKHGNATAGVGPTLKSLDEVLDHLRVRAEEKAPHAVLVMAARAEIDASREAIHLARALLAEERLRVLIDLTRGAAAVSGHLRLPRTPGFAELAAGRAGFDDVVHVDEETPLQVIPAGSSTAWPNPATGNKRLARIFEALEQAYNVIVLHADRSTALTLRPILAGRLQRIVAVLARGEGKSGGSSLLELAVFGCPVLLYEQNGTDPRRSLVGRVARWA